MRTICVYLMTALLLQSTSAQEQEKKPVPKDSVRVAIQKMQDDMARPMNHPGRWSSRLMLRLLPFLFRTGLLMWLQRRERRHMMEGVVPVRLVV